VVISTGKSDWERSVTNEKGSLASYICNIEKAAPLTITTGASTPGTAPSTPIASTSQLLPTAVAGIFKDSENQAVSILNGSHDTLSKQNDNETVLVFPDYKVLTEVPRSLDGAREMWRNSVCPSVSRLGSSSETGTVKSWVIPYTCVILICERLFSFFSGFTRTFVVVHVRSQVPETERQQFSGSHRRRDVRCAVVAPKLEYG
jgi:Sucrase/ferredoxin-like